MMATALLTSIPTALLIILVQRYVSAGHCRRRQGLAN
jgi:ABC-type glycerol-3-phosphate transport system permease component